MKTKFLLIHGDTVAEIIPAEDATFPGVPITARYAPDFLAKCDEVSEETVVEVGYIKTELGYEPAPTPEPEPGPFPPDPPAPEPTYVDRLEAMEAAILMLMGGM